MSVIWNLPTWTLLLMVLFGGAMAAAGVTLYPAASARDDKVRLAHDANAILLPEIEANKKIAASMQSEITPNTIPTSVLEVSAWQTVASGGLLLGLDAPQITKLLRIYNLVFQVNAHIAKLVELTTGISYALQQSPQLRQIVFNQLRVKLGELQTAFADLGDKPLKAAYDLLSLALLGLVGVGGCSASGPEPSFETAYSAVGGQVK